MKKVNLHVYPSPYKFETRINKEVNSIIEMDLVNQIVIAGTWVTGLKEKECQSDEIKIRRIRTFFDSFGKNMITKVLSVILFNIKTFFIFKNERISHINCHSLWVLPLCVALKKATSAKLIYDAHELETERAGLKGIKQKLAKLIEKSLIKHCDKIIVVGDLIANWYKNEYQRNDVYTIRNVPKRETVVEKKSNILREILGLGPENIIFIYQGIINKGRGVDIIIEAFKNETGNKHLVIMGYGNQENLAKEASINFANIHFIPAVPPSDIPLYTSGADVGLFMVENIGLSYYLCLPNKFFEYLYCGLPVIVSDFPEMKSIVENYNCGWAISPNLENFKKIIEGISLNEMHNKKRDLDRLIDEINWEKDIALLKNVFND